jgi:predicted Rossmann-fold nucleotide-binding protein
MDKIIQLVNGNSLKSNIEDKKKVFVCGGASQVREDYYKDAYNLGVILAQNNLAYVQGGVSTPETIMGESYRGYKDAGGDSAYFITRKFDNIDSINEINNLKGAFEVDDIGSLIKSQFLWSDISVIMPGGTGTLMELLGYIEYQYDYPGKKPVVIIYNKQVNNKGIFDNFINQFKELVNEGFISKNRFEETFIVVNTFEELEKTILEHIESKRMV